MIRSLLNFLISKRFYLAPAYFLLRRVTLGQQGREVAQQDVPNDRTERTQGAEDHPHVPPAAEVQTQNLRGAHAIVLGYAGIIFLLKFRVVAF